MKAKNYATLCAAIVVVTALAVLYIPGVSETIETAMLGFLAANAR